MKRILALTCFLLSPFSLNVAASTYQSEFKLGLSESVQFIRFDYYLQPVTTDKGPYAEAEFLNPVSSVFVVKQEQEANIDFTPDIVFVLNLTESRASYGGRYVAPNRSWYGQITFSETDQVWKVFNVIIAEDLTLKSSAIDFGFYTSPDTRFSFEYESGKTYNNLPFGASYDNSRIRFSYRTLETHKHATYGYELSYNKATLGASTDITIINLGFDYYLNKRTGLNFSISTSDITRDEFSFHLSTYRSGLLINVGAQHFISPAFTLSANYQQFSGESETYKDTNELALQANVRF